MKLLETQLPALYSQCLHDKYRWDFGPRYIENMYDVLFTASATMLAEIKSKERPTALVLRALNGVFIAAGIVQYFDNQDDANQPGNWSLVWTFNEEDIPENTYTVGLNDGQVQSYYISYALDKFGIQFKDSATLQNLFTESIIHLKKWLDENASETEEVTVEQDGIFVGRVAVENGEKIFAIEMDGLIKQLIKDDASIEK
jgi:hypothetical protein